MQFHSAARLFYSSRRANGIDCVVRRLSLVAAPNLRPVVALLPSRRQIMRIENSTDCAFCWRPSGAQVEEDAANSAMPI